MAEGFKDFLSAAVLASAEVDDYLMRQSVMRFASAAARDSALSGVVVEGMCAYLKDVNSLTAYDGTSWWTVAIASTGTSAHTPVLSQVVPCTITATVSEYRIINGKCEWWFNIAATSAGSAGTAVNLTTPVTASASGRIVGAGFIFDTSASQEYAGTWELASTTTISMYSTGAGTAYWGATPSIATASGDTFRGCVSFLVAAAA